MEQLASLMAATVPGPESEVTSDNPPEIVSSLGWQEEVRISKAADNLLSRHARTIGLAALTPRQFAFGFVAAFARFLGWDRERFHGQSKEGGPDEILGADTAIRHEYRPATHGSQSPVATFAEKYVWLAIHELEGYLADRLALRVDGETINAPVDPSLLAEVTNPATDLIMSEPDNTWRGFLPSQLTPQITLTSSVQVDCANEWAEKAPLPEIGSLLYPGKDLLPAWAHSNDWVLLRAFIAVTEPHSQGRVIFWTSCALFDATLGPMLVEDSREKVFSEYLHEFSTGISRAASYVDPHEATWAPWIRDSYGFLRYTTLDENGLPMFLDFHAASCRIHWKSGEREIEMFLPAELLRRALGLIDLRMGLHGGQFSDANGNDLAFFHRSDSDAWKTPFSQALFIRRNAFEKALQDAGLAPCWSTRFLREPSAPLLQDGWSRTKYDWNGLSLIVKGKLETIELAKSVETSKPMPDDESNQEDLE
jgi:hypothetical protein